MIWMNILNFCFALSGLFLSLNLTVALPSSPTNNLVATHRYANLSSPVSGQVLYPGRPFRIRYHNQICNANATQISLFNASGLFLIASNISFSNHKTDTHVLLPSWVSNGTYNFVFGENDYAGSRPYQDVVLVTIYVGKRPPDGIGSSTNQDSTPPPPPHPVQQQQPFSQDQPCPHQLIRREPHPPRFDQPLNGSTFSPGSTINILYRDGETTANRVQFVLKSLYTGHHFYLGTLSFAFVAKLQFRLSNFTSEGPYQIFARENSPDDKNTFTNVLSVNIYVSKSHSPANKEPSSLTRDRARRSNYNPIKLTESPTVLLPAPAEVVSLGSTIKCMIYNSLATTETVKFVLRSEHGKDHKLGQAAFTTDHLAGGHFDLPAQIPTGTYSVMVRQNSVARPFRFLNVVSTTVFITNKDRLQRVPSESHSFQHIEAIQFPQPQALATSDLSLAALDFNKPLEQATSSDQPLNKLSQSINHQLVRREPHLPHFKSPVSKQVIPAGSQFLCQFIDGQVSYEKVQFVLRHPQQKTQVIFKETQVLFTLGESSFKSSLASSTCLMPASLTPGLYELVAQENTLSEPKTYSDIASVDIFVGSPVENAPSKRALIHLATREPHPVKFTSPLDSQNIVAGETFDCRLTDGETTATLVKFSLRDQTGNETILGQISFSNFQAQSTFRCPEHLAPGPYALVVQENSSSDPEHFEESSKVQVNVVAKGSTVPIASAP